MWSNSHKVWISAARRKGAERKILYKTRYEQTLKMQRFGFELFSSLIFVFIFYLFHTDTKITLFCCSHITTELCQLYQLFIWLSVQATVQVCSGFSLHAILFFLFADAFLYLNICQLLSGEIITNLKLSGKYMITIPACCCHPEIHSNKRISLNWRLNYIRFD